MVRTAHNILPIIAKILFEFMLLFIIRFPPGLSNYRFFFIHISFGGGCFIITINTDWNVKAENKEPGLCFNQVPRPLSDPRRVDVFLALARIHGLFTEVRVYGFLQVVSEVWGCAGLSFIRSQSEQRDIYHDRRAFHNLRTLTHTHAHTLTHSLPAWLWATVLRERERETSPQLSFSSVTDIQQVRWSFSFKCWNIRV